MMQTIPRDDFTPHGYLDNPYHSWKLNPSGVLRSSEPLGMGWHVPNLGSYARNQFQYTAHLLLGLRVGETVLFTPEDFKRHGCRIVSQLHTKNRFEYTCSVPRYDLTLRARYFLVNEHALGCVLSVATSSVESVPLTLYVIHQHTHNPHTSRLWEHGLYTKKGPEDGTALLGMASEGDAFVHGVRAADSTTLSFADPHCVVSLQDAAAWATGRDVAVPGVTQSLPDSGWQMRTVIVPCHLTLTADTEQSVLNVVLTRGVSPDQASERWLNGIEEIVRAEVEHTQDDERFWTGAPRLSGDWPASWRRGLSYDLETLRMVMRPSSGVIPTFWDGMQIQAPRTVLAEAALDALFLSYADPDLAAEVILGHFEHALHPQLPCMREDGSYNMVADDGQLCGTAPEWGFPVWCCDQIYRRTGDVDWLKRLYPGVAAYLRWWLAYRRDTDGWLTYACSWESGQDVSSRFGPQQTGGTIIQHIRPADLQASMAQAAGILVDWARILQQSNSIIGTLDLASEVTEWREIAREFTLKTHLMWHADWFRDYDSSTQEWSTQLDTMHLAPLFCGIATSEHIKSLRTFLAQPPMHSGWAPLCWPPVVMTLVGAASAASMTEESSEFAYRFIDAAYRSCDSRDLDAQGGLPGVTREYHSAEASGKWGEVSYSNAGIEGYGWGALSIHLLIRYLLGLSTTDPGSVTVAPTLPMALRRPGATYTIDPIPWGEYMLRFTCQVRDVHSYEATFHARPLTQEEQPAELTAVPSETVSAQEQHWQGTWGEERTFLLRG